MGVFERFELQNGLRVLTAPMSHAQSVSCIVMLAAGSRYETPETNGIAHFAEHMFFKGTERRPTARDIAGEIDSIGGEFNAFTGKEYTGYYVKCAADRVDLTCDVARRGAPLGALEEHVLGEMRDPVRLRRLVARARRQHDEARHRLGVRHRRGQDSQPVLQLEALEDPHVAML